MSRTAKILIRNSFWLSLFLHLFLLLIYLFLLFAPRERFKLEKSPEYYVPSYVAQNPMPQNFAKQTTEASKNTQTKKLSTDKNGILKRSSNSQMLGSISEDRMVLTHDMMKEMSNETEPVHLIGDKKIAKPLIKLLGKAIFSRLTYPKIAVDFNMQGATMIGFMIHPNGMVSDVRILKSSGTDIFDNAAMTAINEISPVQHVSDYIKEPQFIVANIVFRF